MEENKKEELMPDFPIGLSVPMDKLVLYWDGPDGKRYSLTMQDIMEIIDKKADKPIARR